MPKLRSDCVDSERRHRALNRVGVDGNDIRYRGGSAIIDYLGQTLVSMADEQAVKTATLEQSALEKFREKFPFYVDADAFTVAEQTIADPAVTDRKES